MGNGFSEEANAPEKALDQPVYNISTIRQGRIAGTWERDKKEKQKALDAELAALQVERNTAPTLARRRIAALKIQKRILRTAQRRNESRRAASEYIRFGQRNTLSRKTQEAAPNAIRNSPLDKLTFYLEVPKREGYYKDKKKLFLALSLITDLPQGCNTVFYEDEDEENKPVSVCDIILNDAHTELSRAIAAIDRRTFMDRFRTIAKLYNDCEKKHQPFASQVTSAVKTATEEAAAIVTNPAEPIVQTFWGWFSGLFTRKARQRADSGNYDRIPTASAVGARYTSGTAVQEPSAVRAEQESKENISLQRPAQGGFRTRRHKRKHRPSK